MVCRAGSPAPRPPPGVAGSKPAGRTIFSLPAGRRERPMITDAAVRELHTRCERAIAAQGMDGAPCPSQAYRGVTGSDNCERHMTVFRTFKSIPKFCFDCYKVQVEPRTVVELIKLLMVFTDIRLPNDNIRKCMIELRADVSGMYKGLVYCLGLDDARDVVARLEAAVAAEISPDIPVALKRGCSEYAVKHPDFNRFDDNGEPVMTYPEAWREDEEYADKYLTRDLTPLPPRAPVTEFTVSDALTLRAWLAFAVAKGEDSYKAVTDNPPPPLDLSRTKAAKAEKHKRRKRRKRP